MVALRGADLAALGPYGRSVGIEQYAAARQPSHGQAGISAATCPTSSPT